MGITLIVKPHSSNGYIIEACDVLGDNGRFTLIIKQHADLASDHYVNIGKEHESVHKEIEWFEALRDRLEGVALEVMPKRDFVRPYDTVYQLYIDQGKGVSVTFEWWKDLPNSWSILGVIVDELHNSIG
jgi:hypothetical protein